MFNKIAILSIPVRDPQISKSFYTEILGGLVLQEMPFGPGAKWIRLEFPGVETRIVLATWFPQRQPGCIQGLVVTTDDILSTHAELTRRGGAISEIAKRPYGQEATFSDPDGNGWVLQPPASN